MNNLAYGTQQQEKIAPQIEEKLRKELGAPAPLQYQVVVSGAAATSAKTVLGDIAGGLVGHHSDSLYTISFDPPQPRPFHLDVKIDRQGVGCHAGLLLYTAQTNKPLKGEVTLDPGKLFSGPKFAGDPDACARLNAKGDLAKRVMKFARTEAELGGMTIRQDRVVRIIPQDGVALVMIGTLGRPTSMGMDVSLDAKEFLDIFKMIEQVL